MPVDFLGIVYIADWHAKALRSFLPLIMIVRKRCAGPRIQQPNLIRRSADHTLTPC